LLEEIEVFVEEIEVFVEEIEVLLGLKQVFLLQLLIIHLILNLILRFIKGGEDLLLDQVHRNQLYGESHYL
jgi:hypothetical protein